MLASYILGSKPGSKLRQLRLAGNRFRDNGAIALAEPLANNTSLRILDLARTDMGPEGAAALAAALAGTSVQQLDLSQNPRLSDKGATVLADVLREGGAVALERLDLAGTSIGAVGVKALCEGLEGNKVLCHLGLQENCPGMESGSFLAKLLLSRPALQSLHLGVPQGGSTRMLGPLGASKLAPGIALRGGGGALTHLDLRGHVVGSKGAIEIGRALKGNPASMLTHLGMAGNRVGVEGVQQLALAIGSCSSLRWVDLSWNDVAEAQGGVHFIAQALRCPECQLTSLDLSHNFIGDAGAQVLATAIAERNPKSLLRVLDLENNRGISELSLQQVSAALGNNRKELAKGSAMDAPTSMGPAA